jgi:type IV pilus assembly protein PilC
MPTFQFEAMDSTGQEIRDEIEAASEQEAQTTIRSMGYYVTKIAVKKAKKVEKSTSGKKKRTSNFGGASVKDKTIFTRQLSILQDAGLPILRSLKILENQLKGGKLKNALMDVCEGIEAGETLSEAMSKCPKVFDRLYVNMIKAGEAGGALEVILRRLAEFMEKSLTLRRKVKGALIYPVAVITVAVLILWAIMKWIVPSFIQIFKDFGTNLPKLTVVLIDIANWVNSPWGLTLFLFPVALSFFVKLMRTFEYGREAWDLYTLKMPIFGQLVEKNILARTTRTFGTMITSGVPILEALNITRDTAGNSIFERMYSKISESIREGESIAKPMKINSYPPFNFLTIFWFAFPFLLIFVPIAFLMEASYAVIAMAMSFVVGAAMWYMKSKTPIVSDLVVNMVDVGEETGELDTMLYKIADTYDEEVAVLTESLQKLMEPLLIIFLGGAVGFIVIALFLPLIELINSLSGGKGKKK